MKTGRGLLMLKYLMKKLKRLADLRDIKTILQNDQANISKSIDSYISKKMTCKRFVKSEIDLAEYIEGLCHLIGKIEEANSRAAQIIFLREFTLDALDQIAITGWYLNDENELGDVAIISRKHSEFDGLQIDQVLEKASDIFHRNVVRFCFLRHLSKKLFEDAAEFDYAILYLDFSNLVEQNENNADLSDSKSDGGDLLEMFLPTLHQRKTEIRKNVLEGQNYDSTPGDEEDNDAEEEKFKKIAEFTDEHYLKLKEILFDRIELFNSGDLYCANGYTPNNLVESIRFDTGLMLIGLVGCVEDKELCIQTIRNLFRDWALSLEISEDSKKQVESTEIPFDRQLGYLAMMEENSEEGWLVSVVHVGTMMIFGISADDYEKFDTNERQAVTDLAVAIMGDVWKIYAQTQNVFGHEIKEGWIGDEHEPEADRELR